MNKELIQSVTSATPSKGSNAGKLMFVINAKYWSSVEPKASETHVCLTDVVAKDGKTYTNVAGYSRDTCMTIADKIKTITGHDASYSNAIALLLK